MNKTQRRINRRLAVVVFLAGAATGALLAQDFAWRPGFQDAGTFVVRRAGKEVGRETFRLAWVEGGLQAEADVTLNLQEGENVRFSTRLLTSAAGKVLSYEVVRSAPTARQLTVTLQNQVAICEQKLERGSQSTPVVVEPGFLVLDTNVFHHFELLVQRLLAGQVAEIPVLIPQEAVAGSLKVEELGRETLRVGKERIAVRQFRLDSGQVRMSLWVDEGGKLYRISVPDSKAEVTRIE